MLLLLNIKIEVTSQLDTLCLLVFPILIFYLSVRSPLFNKFLFIIYVSSSGLETESVMYFSIIKDAIGAAVTAPYPPFST